MFSSLMALSFLCYIGPFENLLYSVINSGDAFPDRGLLIGRNAIRARQGFIHG